MTNHMSKSDICVHDFSACADCEGMLENGTCLWLNVAFCQGKSCPYYRRKGCDNTPALNRLSSLDEELQSRIAKKYYHGKRPWNESVTKAAR